MSIQKSEIKLDIHGKPLNAYLASASRGEPGVLVLPSWWGLKPFFKQVCDQLAAQGYTALAPDYYDGWIGTTIDEAKALQEQAESDLDVMGAMVKAAKDHLASLRTAHWFMEEDRPEYDPAAASLAWERTLAFLKQSLR